MSEMNNDGNVIEEALADSGFDFELSFGASEPPCRWLLKTYIDFVHGGGNPALFIKNLERESANGLHVAKEFLNIYSWKMHYFPSKLDDHNFFDEIYYWAKRYDSDNRKKEGESSGWLLKSYMGFVHGGGNPDSFIENLERESANGSPIAKKFLRIFTSKKVSFLCKLDDEKFLAELYNSAKRYDEYILWTKEMDKRMNEMIWREMREWEKEKEEKEMQMEREKGWKKVKERIILLSKVLLMSAPLLLILFLFLSTLGPLGTQITVFVLVLLVIATLLFVFVPWDS